MIIFVLLLMSVSLGQSAGASPGPGSCLMGIASCMELLDTKDADHCSALDNLMKCLVDITTICFPQLTNFVRGYQILIEEGCRPDSNFFNELASTAQCVKTNFEYYEHCKLEGEFITLADLCRSASNLNECLRLKTIDVCGKNDGKVFQKTYKPISDLTDTCKSSTVAKAYYLSACEKGLVKCDRHITSFKEYSCPDIERTARCYLDIVNRDCGMTAALYAPLLERHVERIPEFCNPESAFRKNLAKSRECIFVNFASITPCRAKVQESIDKVKVDGRDDHQKIVLAQARGSIQQYDCIERKLGSVCGKEAAFVAKFMLSPLEEMLDNSCLQLTGEKCNGVVALHCNLMLLILCAAYFLMKRD